MDERSDYLWAVQYACDLAQQAGEDQMADQMSKLGQASDEELKQAFAMAQLLALGMQIRHLKMAVDTPEPLS